MARVMVLGADWCNAARGFMFAVGCIQAQQCHTGRCPTGVTSQDRSRQRAVVVSEKSLRVANFHRETVRALAELIGAAELDQPSQLRPQHFMRRVAADRIMTFADIYHFLEPGDLLSGTPHRRFAEAWALAQSRSFEPVAEQQASSISHLAQ
jgi:Conserved region in glutamate synthase